MVLPYRQHHACQYRASDPGLLYRLLLHRPPALQPTGRSTCPISSVSRGLVVYVCQVHELGFCKGTHAAGCSLLGALQMHARSMQVGWAYAAVVSTQDKAYTPAAIASTITIMHAHLPHHFAILHLYLSMHCCQHSPSDMQAVMHALPQQVHPRSRQPHRRTHGPTPRNPPTGPHPRTRPPACTAYHPRNPPPTPQPRPPLNMEVGMLLTFHLC